jgi:hypothetical protein
MVTCVCSGTALLGFQHYAFVVFGAYIVVFLAERPNIGSSEIGRRHQDQFRFHPIGADG